MPTPSPLAQFAGGSWQLGPVFLGTHSEVPPITQLLD
jgi:hypothetical protein